uniref:Uncharacterized protein n=1 Tax=Anguilla anguilla TaxID=7936 RepID=A0A0E9SJ04_ANGAN
MLDVQVVFRGTHRQTLFKNDADISNHWKARFHFFTFIENSAKYECYFLLSVSM